MRMLAYHVLYVLRFFGQVFSQLGRRRAFGSLHMLNVHYGQEVLHLTEYHVS